MLIAPPGTRPLMVTLPFTVQTYDIDFAQHVNNQVYVRWLEDLRSEVLRQHLPLDKLMAQNTAPILHSTQITYHKSIELFDKPEGRMWCSSLGRATMNLEAEIVVGEKVCATALQRGILLNIGTTKPVRIPEDLVERYKTAIA